MKIINENINRMLASPIFNRDEEFKRSIDIIKWWEIRRPQYNIIVGGAGIICMSMFLFTALIADKLIGEPIGSPGSPFAFLVIVCVYAIMANICYTGGWITELLVNKLWKDQGKYYGKISFGIGVIFSVGLTIAPGIIIIIVGAIRIIYKIL